MVNHIRWWNTCHSENMLNVHLETMRKTGFFIFWWKKNCIIAAMMLNDGSACLESVNIGEMNLTKEQWLKEVTDFLDKSWELYQKFPGNNTSIKRMWN